MGSLLACPGVELTPAANNTAETDSRVTERAAWSAQALVGLFWSCFIELFLLFHFHLRQHPGAVITRAQKNYCELLITLMRNSCYKMCRVLPYWYVYNIALHKNDKGALNYLVA